MSTTDTTDTFDLADFETVVSADVTIKHPLTGAPTPIVITLAGPEHPARRKAAFTRARKMRADMMKTGKVQLGDPEEDEQDETDQLAAFTLGWKNLTSGGTTIVFTPATARTLYAEPKYRWLRDQVRTALDEREAFIKRSAAA